MKNYIGKLSSALPAVLAILIGFGAGCVFLQWPYSNIESPLVSYSNKYERAQHQTVLIQSEEGQGSGVIVVRSNRIFVWTAAHVVKGASEVKIKTCLHWEGHKAGEIVFKARVLSRDEAHDFALLWLDAPATGYFLGAEFDTTQYPQVGTEIFHVGNFLGEKFDGSVSTGIISQVGVFPADIEGWHWPITDQLAGTIVPGSSGGPIFRASNGKVLGLVVGGVGRGSLGFASYIPLRVLASDITIRWAIWGDTCPSDPVLAAMAIKSLVRPVEIPAAEEE